MAGHAKRQFEERANVVAEGELRDRRMDAARPLTTHNPDGTPVRKFLITNVNKKATSDHLDEIADKYGKVDGSLACKIKLDKPAYITFRDQNDALEARQDGSINEIKLHGDDLMDSAEGVHQGGITECANKLTEEEERDKSLINELNDDCLMYIFQFLPIPDRVRIERVCKRWRAASLCNWHGFRSLAFVTDNDCLTDETSLKKVLLRCGQYIMKISSLFTHNEKSWTMFGIITGLCPNVKQMDLGGFTLTRREILDLSKTYSNLTELRLGECTDCHDSDLKKLFENNLKLKKLSIQSNNKIDGSCLASLPTAIEELVLAFCSNISSSNLSHAVQRLDQLRTLKIVFCSSLRNYDPVLDDFQRMISLTLIKVSLSTNNIPRMMNLKELCVENCNDLVTDAFLFDLVANCVNLTSLNISHCKKVTERGVSKLFFLGNLQHLEMRCVSVRCFTVDKSNVPLKLRTLDCCYNAHLDEKSVCDLIEAAPCLRSVDVVHCRKITNNVLKVAERCSKKRARNISVNVDRFLMLFNELQLPPRVPAPI